MIKNGLHFPLERWLWDGSDVAAGNGAHSAMRLEDFQGSYPQNCCNWMMMRFDTSDTLGFQYPFLVKLLDVWSVWSTRFSRKDKSWLMTGQPLNSEKTYIGGIGWPVINKTAESSQPSQSTIFFPPAPAASQRCHQTWIQGGKWRKMPFLLKRGLFSMYCWANCPINL